MQMGEDAPEAHIAMFVKIVSTANIVAEVINAEFVNSIAFTKRSGQLKTSNFLCPSSNPAA